MNLDDPNVPSQFNVIKTVRVYGDKRTARTEDGKTVRREDRLYFEGYGLVKCAPYDNHFIFDNKSRKVGQWSPVCTCGSPAGIVGANVYANDASPTTSMDSSIAGTMIVCLTHAQTSRHSDGST